MRAFAGSLEGFQANKGVLITTSQFAREAEEYCRKVQKRIVLIDGDMLAELVIDHKVGISTASTYEIKRIDDDYFEDELI